MHKAFARVCVSHKCLHKCLRHAPVGISMSWPAAYQTHAQMCANQNSSSSLGFNSAGQRRRVSRPLRKWDGRLPWSGKAAVAKAYLCSTLSDSKTSKSAVSSYW